jgi:hypothetical protein
LIEYNPVRTEGKNTSDLGIAAFGKRVATELTEQTANVIQFSTQRWDFITRERHTGCDWREVSPPDFEQCEVLAIICIAIADDTRINDAFTNSSPVIAPLLDEFHVTE